MIIISPESSSGLIGDMIAVANFKKRGGLEVVDLGICANM